MARIRTFKPELFTDCKTGRLPSEALKAFLGLLTYADDWGVLQFEPLELMPRIFPFVQDERHLETLVETELLPLGIVELFSLDGRRRYLWIPHFLDHQNVNRPSLPILPGWTNDKNQPRMTPSIYLKTHGALTESSVTPHGALTEHSLGKEGRKDGRNFLPPSVPSTTKKGRSPSAAAAVALPTETSTHRALVEPSPSNSTGESNRSEGEDAEDAPRFSVDDKGRRFANPADLKLSADHDEDT